jgi:thymidylate synthase ThyX
VTSTYWDNFWNLRAHVDAAPEMYKTAMLMREAVQKSTPRELTIGEWHLPYVEDEARESFCDSDPAALPLFDAVKMSVARCAAISFERQHADKGLHEYIKRHDQLQRSGHWSPFEHQARVATLDEIRKNAYHLWSEELERFVPVCIGNFGVPWFQYRKMIPGEDVFRGT